MKMPRSGPLRKIAGLLLLFGTVVFSAATANAQLVARLAQAADSADSVGNYAEGVRLWRQVYSVNGGEPSPLIAVAQSAVRAGNHEEAFRALFTALDQGLVVSPDRLQSAPSFQPLHNDTEWAALIGRASHYASQRDTVLRAELLSLGQRDQANRDSIDTVVRRNGVGSPAAQAASARLAVLDAPLQARLREIVRTHGWPGRHLVGDDAAHAAWLILQHSDSSYQRQMLPVIRDRAQPGDVRAADLALLEDRVRMGQGRKQLYGSALKYTKTPGAPPELYPIEDEECVDQRRAAVLLPPLADYLAMFGITRTARPVRPCRTRSRS